MPKTCMTAIAAIAAIVLFAVTQSAALAQSDAGDQILRGQNKGDVNAGSVTISTTRTLGSPFMRMVLDLSNLLDSGEHFEELRVVPVVARGKVQNLWDILYLRGIDMGLVQTDMFEYLKDDPSLPSIKNRIRYITVMNPAELQIVARKEISSIYDLEGKVVGINAKGTGSSVMATVLFRRLGINAKTVHEDTRQAIARMKKGEMAATVSVLGKPARLIRSIESEGQLHLLPVPYTTEMQDIYLPSTLSSKEYPNLIEEGQVIPTLAVGNVLASFNFKEDSERGRKVKEFVQAFFSNFDKLQQDRYSKGWKEITLEATVPGWTRLKAAQDWLNTHHTAAVSVAEDTPALRQEFNAFLAQSGALPPGADANSAQVKALFQKFLEWRRRNSLIGQR